ncbi:MAG: hypothetical protein D8M58_06980 [Calditrichaeota bacterium]|nr:MAG: hypothetical protein DWQ03_19520 [Calditrichota bacterium]MBL1205123.1 hypothetical protein [Calditrichota bacterium]NOG44953.1 hypothetical protein [Calditrichota bacterium]
MKTTHCLSFCVVIFLMVSDLLASFEPKAAGVSQTSLSLAGVASLYNNFQSFINPSLLDSTNQSVSFFYKNHYGIKDLNQISLHGEFLANSWPVGFGISRYGNKLYSETQLTFATSYSLSDDIKIGSSSSFYFLNIKNYNSDWTYGFSLSFLYTLSSQINIAAVIQNFNEPKIGSTNEGLPVSATIGLMYSPIPEVELLADAYKEDYFDFEYRIGARINIIKEVGLLIGFRENINSFSTGLEYSASVYSIKYGIDIHPVLNLSHALGLNYAF